tara:strand:- start:11 stop:727 length:717 start_codon:yes stop_codon:yes gene_type:complete
MKHGFLGDSPNGGLKTGLYCRAEPASIRGWPENLWLIGPNGITTTSIDMAQLVRQARFKLRASIQDIDYQHPRNLKKAQVAQLAQTDWLERGQNLLITGPCGSGKTYLGCALGHQACLNGLGTRYYRISRLLLELTQAKADGTYQKTLNQLAKVKLLILDDWGLEALKPAHRNDLMEIMDDRHGTHSTMIISQLPTDQWYAAIGDNTLADAILDRLMHNAHRWALKGESMRKRLQEID